MILVLMVLMKRKFGKGVGGWVGTLWLEWVERGLVAYVCAQRCGAAAAAAVGAADELAASPPMHV
jgi:hypothetical protein